MLTIKSTIGKMIQEYSLNNPEQEAIVTPGLRLTFREYHKLTNQFAHFLLEQGVQKGDRVAFLLGVTGAFPISLAAIAKIGAIAVPINYKWPTSLIEWALEHVEAKYILLEDQYIATVSSYIQNKQISFRTIVQNHQLIPHFLEELAQYPSENPPIEVKPEDPYTITFTSKTTGNPIGVVSNQNAFFTNGVTGTGITESAPGSRYLFATPLFHISGVGVCSYHSFLGMTAVFLPELDPYALLDIIEREKITITFLPPSLLAVLLPMIQQSDSLLPSLKRILSGGSKVPIQLTKDYEDLGFEIAEIYGMTEIGGCVSAWKPKMGYDKQHTVGRAYLSPEVKVLDFDTRQEVKVGEIGELAVRGPQVFMEYWKDPEATRNAFYEDWYLTGDAVRVDSDGFIEIVDRYVIFLPGFGSVYPSQVEKVIRLLPDVTDVSVIGLHHEKFGEYPCAFIQVSEASILTKREVLAHVHEHLSRYHLLDAVVGFDQLPRNAAGKIDKKALEDLYQNKRYS
ncbi:class I adenylate-forming enzyme family protein [Risungbinella massiliensis]|uniref:class I adenylate-forming enzyme family protein n=1 Tax=Risungbinella massiliensis TaxID=1329796 RepID=UPI0005CC7964|nr:AMP-binding protein [Risungbinella massiliensis]